MNMNNRKETPLGSLFMLDIDLRRSVQDLTRWKLFLVK